MLKIAMLKLFDEQNAILLFENGKYIKVLACGKKGLFLGFLTFIDGKFSASELQEYGNEYQFFLTNQSLLLIDELKTKKHTIMIANNFVQTKNIKSDLNNTTLVYCCPQEISNKTINGNCNLARCNNIKCLLFFPEDINKINLQTISQLTEELSVIPSTINCVNFLNNYQIIEPFHLNDVNCKHQNNFKHFSIFYNKKTIAILDLGISEKLLKLLHKYFNIIIVPYNESYMHISYLYVDKKIDSVILPDFICNTNFIQEKQKIEISKLLNSKIPVLGIGNGGILMAETIGAETKSIDCIYNIDNYCVTNTLKKQFIVSNFCNKQLISLPEHTIAKYYDKHANVVGFEQKGKNNIGFIFSFFSNNLNTAFFLDQFYNIIKKCK